MSQAVGACQVHQSRKGDVLWVHSEVEIKTISTILKINLSLKQINLHYTETINDVALVLVTYSQIATRHCLCSRDASGVC